MELLDSLQEQLGVRFRDQSLLLQALTHPSFAQHSETPAFHYQRLEFVGDAVLSLFLAEKLYYRFPEDREGMLSRYRSHLAGGMNLGRVAAAWGLGKFLRVGRTEEKAGLKENHSVLEDLLEALFGAVYLDQGLAVLWEFAERVFAPYWEDLNETKVQKNAKSQLQELVQEHFRGNPLRYELERTVGPDHNKEFTVVVKMGERVLGVGTASTKKRAQEFAAREALRNRPLEWKE